MTFKPACGGDDVIEKVDNSNWFSFVVKAADVKNRLRKTRSQITTNLEAAAARSARDASTAQNSGMAVGKIKKSEQL